LQRFVQKLKKNADFLLYFRVVIQAELLV